MRLQITNITLISEESMRNLDELETLLLQKDAEAAAAAREISSRPPELLSPDGSFSIQPSAETPIKTISPVHEFHGFSPNHTSSPSSSIASSHYRSGNGVNKASLQDQSRFSPPDILLPIATYNTPAPRAPIGSSMGLDVMWPNWPPNLPGAELLRHL